MYVFLWLPCQLQLGNHLTNFGRKIYAKIALYPKLGQRKIDGAVAHKVHAGNRMDDVVM